MKKNEIIQKIRDARLAHIKWVQRAKSLVNGFPIEKDAIPLSYDSCAFGQWFYGDGQILRAIFNEKSVNEVENFHIELHDEYMNIFKIYFDLNKLGFFAKIFKNTKKISEYEREQATRHLRALEEISQKLIQRLNIMETKINMADEEIFEKYV